MSKISLAPNAAGSAIFTIESPGTSTNRTLTLPDDTGTIVTNSGNQAGSFTTLNTSGAVVFNDAGADVDFRVEGDTDANLLVVDASADKVGIGASPTEKLSVSSNGVAQISITNSSGTTKNTQLIFRDNAGVKWRIGMDVATNNNTNIFQIYNDVATAAAMSINSSGNVGIGTTTTTYARLNVSGGIQVSGNYSNFAANMFTADFNAGFVRLNSFGADTSTAGGFQFYGYSSNALAGTERARITSGGYFKASNTGSYAGATDNHHEFSTDVVGGVIFRNRNTSAVPYGEEIRFTGASPDNNTNYFLLCADSTANRTIIYSDGDVWTSDAGTLSSDQKLKNTITDASPKLDDVMKLRVRNFYWNEDYHPEKTDKKLIGFIAQEFEEVFPGLVTEGVIRGGNPIYEDQAVVDEEGNPVLDEEGNAKTEQVQVGETEKEYAKGIKEGKLIPILVKALQEAVERIETLEAKVAALEANNGV